MKHNFVNSVSVTGALGLLLIGPGLASAEDYYRKTKGYLVERIPIRRLMCVI